MTLGVVIPGVFESLKSPISYSIPYLLRIIQLSTDSNHLLVWDHY